ncbi:transglutaminase-like domain-containing protein [Marinobacter sp. S6332]|uniref:transglutaminase-like domain-containing protein n=1 Tax=Marinobacter sp. S6332 TaxID=2926403 RepID=UPI001FF55251|nr:transglutaminase-like domain-containing protein [Marinobacter sp. S6332]MCK0162549.1 transglutaminase-like domain-containing protein [Marinobacter sp. S6332]
MNVRYTAETAILNYSHASIQHLIDRQGWRSLSRKQAVKSIYYFVRDEIKFGYNRDDSISASDVLANGYGQCNTKGTLFMALLRALDIPCRFHGFTIFNALQRGAIPTYLMPFAPNRILHSWVEVLLDGEWLNVEGFIIDQVFLTKVQQAFPNRTSFSGYGISVPCLQKPSNEFDGNDTYIQAEGIADDFGVFDNPDEFYSKHGSNLRGLKKVLYRYVLRHLMNLNVQRIRQNGLTIKR